jgi:transposase
LPPGTPVALEAAYGWGWLVELREELELEPQLVQPSRCKAIAAARLKNDQVAAATTLAPLLGADLLPEAWITPQPVGDLRALLRHRAALVRLSTRASIGSTSCSLTVGSPRTGSCGPVLGGCGWPASSCRRSQIARLERQMAGLAKPDHGSRRSWSCPAWVG